MTQSPPPSPKLQNVANNAQFGYFSKCRKSCTFYLMKQMREEKKIHRKGTGVPLHIKINENIPFFNPPQRERFKNYLFRISSLSFLTLLLRSIVNI